MMIVLVGKMAAGKSTVARAMENLYGYKRSITDTTRKPREGERDGVDYNFLTQEEFLKNIEDGLYAEYMSYDSSFGHVYYGSRTSLYTDSEDSVIVLNPYGLENLIQNDIPHISIYLRAKEDTLMRRLAERGDDPAEISRRLEADENDFYNIEELCDYIIDIDGLTPKNVETAVLMLVEDDDDSFRKTREKSLRLKKRKKTFKKQGRNKRINETQSDGITNAEEVKRPRAKHSSERDTYAKSHSNRKIRRTNRLTIKNAIRNDDIAFEEGVDDSKASPVSARDNVGKKASKKDIAYARLKEN